MCSFPGGQRQVSLPLPFGLFLPAHPHRAIRAVFGPVGLRREHGPAYGAAFHPVPALADLGVQGCVQQVRTAALNHRHIKISFTNSKKYVILENRL